MMMWTGGHVIHTTRKRESIVGMALKDGSRVVWGCFGISVVVGVGVVVVVIIDAED